MTLPHYFRVQQIPRTTLNSFKFTIKFHLVPVVANYRRKSDVYRAYILYLCSFGAFAVEMLNVYRHSQENGRVIGIL